MTASPAPSRCEHDDDTNNNKPQQPQVVVLQSLLSELSFCEPTIDTATATRDMTVTAAVVLGRSKAGLFCATSTCQGEEEESLLMERRNSGGSYSSSSSESSISVTRTIWKTAVDPVSGRTYYYDSISRITQWEKPDEIRKLERQERKQKQRELKRFFREMESNIRDSLDRGEPIPGVALEETPQGGPPQEPLLMPSAILAAAAADEEADLPSIARVRTISCMNEKLLAQVQTADNIMLATKAQDEPPTGVRSALIPMEGRPPLPQRRPSQQPEEIAETCILNKPLTSSVGFDLPPSLTDGDALRGEALLDESSSSLESQQQQQPEKTSPPPSHVRRNTGGTIYVQTTMDNPDVQATIKAVCGVYRAHIVQSAALKSQRSPVSVATTGGDCLDIFRDDHEEHHQPNHHHYHHDPYHAQRGGGNSSSYLHGPVKNDKASAKDPEIPALEEIELFYQDFYRRSQMEHDTIIMSLIYVERLIKSTNGALTPAVHNWRSILFACMVLSSKVWDDLSMYNIDFSQVSRLSGTGICSFSLQRTNALELAVLTSLNFDVRVPAGEYARYYFLLRTMLSRSGMLVGPQMPLTKTHGCNLESRALQYQELVLSGQRLRRTRSVDWASKSSSLSIDDAELPILKDTLCLEQLICMNR